jgi:DDE superfamily endonuclease
MDEEKRSMFCQKIENLKKEDQTIVYIDESGFAHDMKRTHCYSKKGERCYGIQDWGAKGRTNAIGALIGKTLLTVMLITANVDTNVFTSWVQQDLIPKLPDKSIIVMDIAKSF